MKDGLELVEEFNRNVSRFFATKSRQRNETFLAYEYRDGNQHLTQSRPSFRKNKIITTVNLAAPVIRAVAGSEAMAAATLSFTSIDPEFDEEADIIDDAIQWCQTESGYYSERAQAVEDAVTCGIGAFVTYLDMSLQNFPAGAPVVERIFPNFVTYDDSARGSQMNMKARWCHYAEPVDREWLQEYIEREAPKGVEGVTDFKGYLLSYQNNQNYEHVDFLHHYYWYEYVDIFDVQNPFGDNRLSQIVANDPDLSNTMGEIADELEIDWQAEYWTLDGNQLGRVSEFADLVRELAPDEAIDKLQYSKRYGKMFYRAVLGGGKLIKASPSYTQNGHALNFITGYFEESTGQYYGMMRPLSRIQDYLNISMTDLLNYVKAASHGGSAYIKGAGDAFERVYNERMFEDDLTPLPDSAEIIAKARVDTPQVLLNFVTMMQDLMPRVLGLGPEFFGAISTGDMTDSLYGRILRQSFAVLENWRNNAANADIRQGRIFEDLVRMMADANNGMILAAISDNNDQKAFVRLKKQNLARNYSLRVVERPMTKDEKQDAFNKLLQLAPQMMQAGVNLYPVLAKLSPFDKGIRDAMEAMAAPQPAQPDPAQQAMTQAQMQLLQAEAQKTMAEAQKVAMEAQDPTERRLDAARTKLEEAKTAQILAELSQAQLTQFNAALQYINQMRGM